MIASLYRMDFRDYDTRLAAYALVQDERGRVLLALWNEADDKLWTMPGGGVELYEGTEQAAVREVEEETGYTVQLTELLGVDAYVIEPHDRLTPSDRPLKGVRVVYRADVISGELRNEIEGTTDEARWFSLGEIGSLRRASIIDRSLQLAGLLDQPPIG